MIPKEKAIELLEGFRPIAGDRAKEVGLKFVDEILVVLETVNFPDDNVNGMVVWYWTAVRRHMERL